MEYRPLGGSGFQVSAIGMGCVTFGREIDEAASFAILDHAFQRGINLFDTAEAYAEGASETVLGRWINDRGVRDKLVLATKVTRPLTKQRIISSAEESLKRLQTECIDLFQLHVWDNDSPLEESLDALDELVQAGKVRSVGCSNWRAWQLAKGLLHAQQAGYDRLQSVQPPYNLVQREIEDELLPLCRDQDVGILAYSPLAAGFLAGKYQRGKPVPKGTRFDVIPGHQPIYFTDHGFDVLDRLRAVSRECGLSMVQLALAWVLRQPGITCTLVGARTTSHIDQAFDALAGRLDETLLQSIA